MVKFHLILIYCCTIFLLISSCAPKSYSDDPLLEKALQMAGNNRSELVKVLGHYSAPEDSLKYKAAVFLIKYMPGRYAKVFPDYDLYKSVFDTLEMINEKNEGVVRTAEFYKFYKISVVTNLFPQNLWINRRDSSFFEIEEDIKTITADYLIENVDYAFKAWNMPWARHLTFAEFCEYILPYRYGNEELQSWRKQYFENTIHDLYSVKNIKDPIKAGMYLNRIGEGCFSEVPQLRELTDAIKPLDLLRINTSTSCKDQSGIALLRMRGLGIPVTRFSTPNWGNRDSGHDFNAILSLEKKWVSFQNQRSGVYQIPSIFKVAKVYAETYSWNGSSIYTPDRSKSFGIRYKDVTEQIVDVSELTILFEDSENENIAGLFIFNNEDWILVARSRIHNGEAVFPQVGRDIIYMSGIIANGTYKLKNDPFLLTKSGVIKPIRPSSDEQILTLDRKFPYTPWIADKYPTLTGGVIQGSNDSTFADVVDLWEIDTLTSMHTARKKLTGAAFQYVRFVFPAIEKVNEGLSGFQFYGQNGDDEILLTGEAISSTKASKTFYSSVFDDNVLTYVRLVNENHADFPQFNDGNNLVIPDKQPFWVGLKLKDTTDITTVEISPRTDDNGINKGEPYELFYWDKGGWISLGEKIATGNSITYTGPKSALYLLRNTAKGKEHRIFLYQDNKQVWY